MAAPDTNPLWNPNDSLATRIAALAEVGELPLSNDAFRTAEFLRGWEQKIEPDKILTPLFFELGIIEPDPNKIPADTYLHKERLEYDRQREEQGKQDFEAKEFARVVQINENSAFARAFKEYRLRVEDLRDRFFDIPLDRAEMFGHFVITRVLNGEVQLPDAS
jgi:hypothetical protein